MGVGRLVSPVVCNSSPEGFLPQEGDSTGKWTNEIEIVDGDIRQENEVNSSV